MLRNLFLSINIFYSVYFDISSKLLFKILRNSFNDFIVDLINDMVTEEKDLKSQIEQRVVDFTNKLSTLTEELGLPKFQVCKTESNVSNSFYMCMTMCIYILHKTGLKGS